jgi:hypothetical protein
MRVSLDFFACRQSGMFKPGLSCPPLCWSDTELPRQAGKLRYGKLFGSRSRRDPRCAHALFCVGRESFQALTQHFSPLAECGSRHLLEIG